MFHHRNLYNRRGTTSVEAAVILPVFFFLVFAIIEFGHASMVNSVLNSACRNAARIGAIEGTSTAQVIEQVSNTLGNVISTEHVDIYVKDASAFDSSTPPSTSSSELLALPSVELADSEPRQLFLVRASIPYNRIALIPMPFMDEVVLSSQSFMRHE